MSPALHTMPRLSLAGLGGIAHALAVYPLFQFLDARALLHMAPPSDVCSHYHDTPHPFLRCRNPAQKYTSKCLPIAPLSLDTLVSPRIWSALTPFLFCFYLLSSISTKPRPAYFCQRGSSPPYLLILLDPRDNGNGGRPIKSEYNNSGKVWA